MTRRLICNFTYVQGFSDLHVNSIQQYCPCRPREQTSSPPRVGVRVRVRVRSGVGLIWAAQPSFCADLHKGSRHSKTATCIEFTCKKSKKPCNFAGAVSTFKQTRTHRCQRADVARPAVLRKCNVSSFRRCVLPSCLSPQSAIRNT